MPVNSYQPRFEKLRLKDKIKLKKSKKEKI